jgi:hypothetical protein
MGLLMLHIEGSTWAAINVSWREIDEPLQGTPPYGGTYVYGISGSQVVGKYYTKGNVSGFVYNGTSFTTLNDPLGTAGTAANGTANQNIVGVYYTSSQVTSGFLYNGSMWTTLTDPSAGMYSGQGTFPFAMYGNDIVGYYQDSLNQQHGFLYNGSSWTTLNYPVVGGARTQVYGIYGNTLVGRYQPTNGGDIEGFTYNYITGIWTNIEYPGSEVSATQVTGIWGQDIVGIYSDGSGDHGFVYDGSNYNVLNNPVAESGLGTEVTGIYGNEIVGWTYSPGGGNTARGYIATIPEPTTLIPSITLAALLLPRRFLRSLTQI